MKQNRRSFVKTAIAAGAAPWIVPAGVVRAQDGVPVPSERVTFALIGCGNMGPAGMREVLKNKDAQVIATCDVFKDRAENHKNAVDGHYQTKGCAAYQDFRELLARKDLDCVEIATGDHWHVPMALLAIRAGKDVYVEKPLGTAMKWAWALREEINTRKAVFQFGTWQRSVGHFRKACELVQNGVIGKVQRVEVWSHSMATDVGGIFNEGSELRKFHQDTKEVPPPETLDYDLWLGPAPKKAFTNTRVSPHGIYHISDYALGFIAGWGIHPLDIAQWGLGMDLSAPVSYKGTGRFPDIPGLFDTLAVWDVECKYANGVEMHFMDWSVAKPITEKYRPDCDHGTTFFGEKGWVSVDRGALRTSDKEWQKIAFGENDVRLYASKGNQWDNFIQCVKTRGPTVNPIESAVNGDLICHLSDIAIRTGRTTTWDPKAEAIVNDAAAEKFLDRTPRAPWTIRG